MNRASTENGRKLRDTGLKAVGEVPWGTPAFFTTMIVHCHSGSVVRAGKMTGNS